MAGRLLVRPDWAAALQDGEMKVRQLENPRRREHEKLKEREKGIEKEKGEG